MPTPVSGNTNRRLDDLDDADTLPPPAPRRDAEPTDLLSHQLAAYDALTLDYIRNASKPPPPPASDDRILYLGFNTASAGPETRALGPSTIVLGHSTGGATDTITVGARLYDLSVPSEAQRYADTLGLPPAQATAVANVLSSAEPGSRDALARIADQWAKGLASGQVPSRLVLSGHSDGEGIFGDAGGHVVIRDVLALARAMPAAAARVEDIHFAACNTAKNGTAIEERRLLLAAFPNLKTFWGYQGSSPMAPVVHLDTWQRATVGPQTSIANTDALRSEGVTVVDAGGHADGTYINMPWAQFQTDLEKAEKYYKEHFVPGFEPTGSATGSNLYKEYQLFQAACARNDPGIDKQKFSALAAQALRLRFYDEGVRENFQTTYGAQIAAGYKELGRPPVDFGKLSRNEAVVELRKVLVAIEAKPSPTLAKLYPVLKGFLELNPETVPREWCGRHE